MVSVEFMLGVLVASKSGQSKVGVGALSTELGPGAASMNRTAAGAVRADSSGWEDADEYGVILRVERGGGGELRWTLEDAGSTYSCKVEM